MEPSTIVAVVTAPIASGVGIIRLSGPCALSLGRTVATGLPETPEPRRAYFSSLTDGRGGVLDQGLALYFQGPHSFTGEDVVELHAHGSPKVLELLTDALTDGTAARLAGPGEFSRRAFMNGKLDLARAEAIADLISAESDRAVRAAAAQLRGGLSESVARIRLPVVALRAELEGALEFPDEADDVELDGRWAERLADPISSLRELLRGVGLGRVLRRSARVVLFGPVNAGKSTLFNRLLGEERALVDAEPGTTRDAIEGPWRVAGVTLTLVDTAGLREQADRAGRIEALGIARARDLARGADLVLLVLPVGTSEEEVGRWARELEGVRFLRIVSKADLATPPPGPESSVQEVGVEVALGGGLDRVEAAVRAELGLNHAGAVAVVSARHASALREALAHLERASHCESAESWELISGELALALEALSEVTGEDASSELLDAVFQRFCIGK